MPTIYDHIAANRVKTTIIVLLFPLVLAVLMYGTVYAIAYFSHNPEASYTPLEMANYLALQIFPYLAGGALLWMAISYFGGGNMMMATANAHEINRIDNPEIYSLVQNTAIAAGLPTPLVYIIPDDSSNAFATGRNPKHSAVALTRGIIKKLDRSELEAVIAHELSHIGNRDVAVMMLVVTGIGALTFIGQILLRTGLVSPRGRGDKKGGGILVIIGLVLMVYGLFLAPLIMYALSRRREYQADASAALITRNPGALASALAKISGDSSIEALHRAPLMGAACIADAKDWHSKSLLEVFTGLYSTHPPVKARIQALQQMDGLR